MRPWFAPRRAVEATPDQVIAAGGYGGGYGVDPVDGDTGYTRAGASGRQVPPWTLEKARTYSVTAYRMNPMARAIIDTYTSFCVGDSGVTYQVTNDDVREVVDEFWNDPRNNLGGIQELFLRDQLLNGETLLELLVGGASGVVRFNPIDTTLITDIALLRGNPLWPAAAIIRTPDVESGADTRSLTIAAVDDVSGLRTGEAMFWAPHKALLSDRRGMPFLSPVLDWLDSYDTILSNLIDRTALARYLVWDVTVQGTQTDVDAFIAARGGSHIPRSGTIEVHNQSVAWEPKSAPSGAFEDAKAGQSVLTSIAGGTGLAKTWLAEPEDANRATSLTMAEPVRRRVGGVQRMWLAYQTELVRFAVDQAVAAKRLPETVTSLDPKTGNERKIRAAQSVTVTGPEVAAADAQITAQVLLNLSTGLEKLVQIGALTREAAHVAAKKAWEDFVGVPYDAALGSPDANAGDVATAVADAQAGKPKLRAVGPVPTAASEARGNAEQLHHYWTRGEGLAKWADSPHPWTALEHHLLKFMGEDEAKRTAAEWFHDVFHYWPGSDLNRVTHGKPPRGQKVGPG